MSSGPFESRMNDREGRALSPDGVSASRRRSVGPLGQRVPQANEDIRKAQTRIVHCQHRATASPLRPRPLHERSRNQPTTAEVMYNARDRKQESVSVPQSGHTYRLSNTRTRTVLDMSMKDWRSLSSAAWDASDNQKWVAERVEPGNSWTIRSVATGLFLGVGERAQLGASVIATQEQTFWELDAGREPSTFRLVALTNPRLGVQLGPTGRGVILGDSREGCEWLFEQV
ncbi:hypothetical protein C8Q78DRAFT_285340 [Trametes maxima]|nr:hypothetical protein C8Q78DRAFT_285340 [Trametes maxima]